MVDEMGPRPIWRRCQIHVSKMHTEGWYTTAVVLFKAAERIKQLEQETSFLLDRLSDFEGDLRDGQGREWYGHVRPSIERLKGMVTTDAVRG